jgi:transposase
VARVIIGVDPHKRSATIEVINEREQTIGQGRFGTDSDGYQAMLAASRRHKDREWAVEGCNGIGRHVAQRLVADGETVVDVPAKLSARARVFTTGQGRKTDPVDARTVAVAVVALRTPDLRRVQADDTTVALRLLVDRRDQLGRARTELVSRLHHLLLELLPGGAKKDLSAQQARALLGTVRPRDVVGKTRRWLASELIHELVVIDKKIKIAKQELTELVGTTGSRLLDLHGIGPSGAARLLGDVGDIRRFASRAHFASWNGTGPDRRILRRQQPPPALPGRQPADQPSFAHHGHRPAATRHRRPPLLPAPTRRRQTTDGSATRPETTAFRRRLPADARRRQTARDGPGRTRGGDSDIQRGRPNPHSRHFGQVTSRTRRTTA